MYGKQTRRQTQAMTNSLSIAGKPFAGLQSLPKRQAPKVQDDKAAQSDSVDLTSAGSRDNKSLSWGKMALGVLGLGAVALGATGCEAKAPVETEEVILHNDTDFGKLPFNLSREADGDVVVAFDQVDRVFNPADNEAYDAPQAAFQANYERGKGLCEQASDLGGNCVTPSLAFIPNGTHGTLQVEQLGPNTIQIGPAQLTRSQDGVMVSRPGPDVYFQYDGNVTVFPNR